MAGLSVLSRWPRVVAGGLVAAGLVVGSVSGGGSASAAAPNWWFDAYHIGQAHAAGWTGKGVKIAVIDDQIDPTLENFKDTHLTVDKKPLCMNSRATPITSDVSVFHADTVTSMLVGNGVGPGAIQGVSPGATVRFSGSGAPAGDNIGNVCAGLKGSIFSTALRRAVDSGAQIITTSLAWQDTDKRTAREIVRAIAKGVFLISGVPDNSTQRKLYASPQGYNGVVSVNAVDSSGVLMTDSDTGGSNVDPNVTVAAAGVGITRPTDGNTDQEGSSFAAPLVAGMVADAWGKFPTATGNQMVQLLVHTANSAGGAEGYGHGVASLTNMLAGDPLKYPDVNPVTNKRLGIPTAAQMRAAARTASEAGASRATAGASGAATKSSSMVGVLVGVGVLVLVGVVVLVVVLVRRSRRPRDQAVL